MKDVDPFWAVRGEATGYKDDFSLGAEYVKKI
jgi:hypothetical protein